MRVYSAPPTRNRRQLGWTLVTTIHDRAVRGFASDNYSGVHPEVLEAIAAANDGHQIAYGEDVYTTRLQ